MKKIFLITALCTTLFASCKKSESNLAKSGAAGQDTIVLFNRASSKPFMLSDKSIRKASSNLRVNDLPGVLDFRYYLGRGYSLSSGGPERAFPVYGAGAPHREDRDPDGTRCACTPRGR